MDEKATRKATRWENFGQKLQDEMAKIKNEKTGKPIDITELAKRCVYPGSKEHVSRVHLSRIINGGKPSDRMLEMIAHGLGRTTDEGIDEVRRWAGYASELAPVEIPPSLRHFSELPIELQEIIARLVETLYQQSKTKKPGKR